MNFDFLKCPICGEYLVDHLGMFGTCSVHGIFKFEDLNSGKDENFLDTIETSVHQLKK